MKKNDVPDTIMSDCEIEEMAMGYTTISLQEREKRLQQRRQPKKQEKTRRLPNGEIDWDAVFGVKKRQPVHVSDEIMTDAEIDQLAR